MNISTLSFIIATPLVFGVVICVLASPKVFKGAVWLTKLLSFLGAAAPLVLLIQLVCKLDFSQGSVILSEVHSFAPSLGLRYAIGINSIAALFGLSITFLIFLIVATNRLRSQLAVGLVLIAECGMLGSLFAQDLLFFYFFWELMLLPMFFIVTSFGDSDSEYSANKFIILTFAGSVLMLVSIMYLGAYAFREGKELSFLISDLKNINSLTITTEVLLAVGFMLAFLVKIPVFPLHTWLKDATCKAPLEGALIFISVLFQLGIFCLITLLFPLFPRSWIVLAPILGLLAVISIIYGAMLAFAERNYRALIAYSSISHLGLCTLGVTCFSSLSIVAVVFHSVAHAYAAAGILIIIGYFERRLNIFKTDDATGLIVKFPVLTTLFFILLLGYLAFPLTSGFVGELGLLISAIKVFPTYGLFALVGVVLGALYMLNMFSGLFLGQLSVSDEAVEGKSPFSFLEWCFVLPTVVLTLLMGIFPTPVLKFVASNAQVLEDNLNLARLEQGQSTLPIRTKLATQKL